MTPTATYIIIIVCMLIFSAFFSAGETAFNSANRSRLKKSAEDGKKTAKAALRITENFTSALSAILIGNNLVNIAASSFATLLFIELLGVGNEGLASLISTVV